MVRYEGDALALGRLGQRRFVGKIPIATTDIWAKEDNEWSPNRQRKPAN